MGKAIAYQFDYLSRKVRFNSKEVNYAKFVFFFAFFFSMQPWFFYSRIPSVLYIIVDIFLLIPLLKTKLFSSKLTKQRITTFVLLTLSIISYGLSLNWIGLLSQAPLIIYIFIILQLKKEIRCVIIDALTKWIAIVLSISIVFYLAYVIHPIELPKFYPTNGLYPYGFSNQYVNLIITYTNFYRFQSVFIEPGHMVMGIFPLVFLNRLNLRNNYVKILILAIILSLSLAGYILLFLSSMYFAMTKGKLKWVIFSILFVATLLGSAFFYASRNADSIIAIAILDRLMYSEEKQSFAGDNRVNESIQYAYDKVVRSNDIWFGTNRYDKYAEDGGNNGYKIILVRTGIAQLLLVSLSYLSVALFSRNKQVYAFVLILLLMISQNYYPYWPSTLILLLYGSDYIKCRWLKNKNSKV